MTEAAPATLVVVIGLGGTIAMTASDAGGVVPTLTVARLVAALPWFADSGIQVEAVDLGTRPSASLTFPDLADLAARVDQALGAGAVGVVVTQGTDTIEETAYLLDLRHQRSQPIVVTGAMRNPTLAGADGPANLLAAIRVAASPSARDLGCLVVLDDEIHGAARVRKAHSTSTGAFVSTNGGPLGYLVEGVPHIVNHPGRRYTLAGPLGRRQPRIGLYPATLGDDGEALAALARRLDGLVIAGFGAGHVPATWVEHLSTLAARMPVVLASRTGAGPILTGTYGFPGGERDLLARGLIPAGLLDPYKARILLYLALAIKADRTAIAAAFHAAGGWRSMHDDVHDAEWCPTACTS